MYYPVYQPEWIEDPENYDPTHSGGTSGGSGTGGGETGGDESGEGGVPGTGTGDGGSGLGSSFGSLGDALSSKFPFCIPWDIYNLLNLFNSEPVAPVFDLSMEVPYIGTQAIHVDLSPFSPVAAVCRALMLVLFMIGLAFVSHKIMTGGGE